MTQQEFLRYKAAETVEELMMLARMAGSELTREQAIRLFMSLNRLPDNDEPGEGRA